MRNSAVGAGIVVTFHLKLKPSIIEDFCAGLQQVLNDTASRPGFRNIKALRHEERPDELMYIEEWDSAEAYRSYLAWRQERGDMDILPEISTSHSIDIWPNIVASA